MVRLFVDRRDVYIVVLRFVDDRRKNNKKHGGPYATDGSSGIVLYLLTRLSTRVSVNNMMFSPKTRFLLRFAHRSMDIRIVIIVTHERNIVFIVFCVTDSGANAADAAGGRKLCYMYGSGKRRTLDFLTESCEWALEINKENTLRGLDKSFVS